MGTLYIVSTPIGHLADVTYRAVDTLRAADHILAEDTRHTRRLLARYDVETALVSLHEHNEAARIERVLAWLDAGESLALVSDAGTPLLSDPGARVVAAALEAGHTVAPVPGPSALLAALAAAGLATEPFTFFGFLPRSGRERGERLEEIGRTAHTVVLYEAPTRLARLLADLAGACGGERSAVVAREMTKVHEEFRRGTLVALVAYYEEREARGEIVVVLGPSPARAAEESAAVEAAARVLARDLLRDGARPSAVARELVRRFSLPRNLSYRIAQETAEKAG